MNYDKMFKRQLGNLINRKLVPYILLEYILTTSVTF